MRHNRYWTGPEPPPTPKNCKHRSMTFIIADPNVYIRCMDCNTQEILRIDEANKFTTDQAQSALTRKSDWAVPILSAQDLKKMWK